MSDEHDLIDACVAYIESKNAHYLAKEGHAVNYASPTGRKSDYAWHKTTVVEMLRMIKAMRLTPKQAVKLKEHHLIAAFQELGRVYEYGIKTRHKVEDTVFNYLEHCDTSLADEVMLALSSALDMRGYRGLLLMEVSDVYVAIMDKLHLPPSFKETRELICKHFEVLGYEIRAGANRPLFEGKKNPAIIKVGFKPSCITHLTEEVTDPIINSIYGELK